MILYNGKKIALTRVNTGLPQEIIERTLTEIRLDKNVKQIGAYAFYRYDNLKNVTIPEGVTIINDSAFGDCKSLGDIVLPSTVTKIIDTAFSGCTNLTDICVPWAPGEVNGEDTCWGATNATIHFNAFSGTAGLRYTGSTCHGMGANNNPIIVIAAANDGNVIRAIAEGAFRNELKLEQVTLPSTLQSVGADAFNNCNSLLYVHTPDLAGWFNISFSGKTSNPLHTGAALMVNGLQLRELAVPEEVTAIGQYAFYQASGLQSVTLHDGVQSVGTEAFNGCQNVTRVVLSKNLKVISRHAFWLCRIRHDIEIPATVTDIGKRAFGPYASGPKRVTFKGTPTGTINSLAFNSAYITDIFVPWTEGAVANAPWGATNATIHYNSEV